MQNEQDRFRCTSIRRHSPSLVNAGGEGGAPISSGNQSCSFLCEAKLQPLHVRGLLACCVLRKPRLCAKEAPASTHSSMLYCKRKNTVCVPKNSKKEEKRRNKVISILINSLQILSVLQNDFFLNKTVGSLRRAEAPRPREKPLSVFSAEFGDC